MMMLNLVSSSSFSNLKSNAFTPEPQNSLGRTDRLCWIPAGLRTSYGTHSSSGKTKKLLQINLWRSNKTHRGRAADS